MEQTVRRDSPFLDRAYESPTGLRIALENQELREPIVCARILIRKARILLTGFKPYFMFPKSMAALSDH